MEYFYLITNLNFYLSKLLKRTMKIVRRKIEMQNTFHASNYVKKTTRVM